MTPARAAFLGLALALIGPALLHCAARAEPMPLQSQACGERHDILRQLRESYAEGPHGLGITNNGGVMELLVSPSGSWTLLFSMPNGRSCLVATGDEWEPRPPRERNL